MDTKSSFWVYSIFKDRDLTQYEKDFEVIKLAVDNYIKKQSSSEEAKFNQIRMSGRWIKIGWPHMHILHSIFMRCLLI